MRTNFTRALVAMAFALPLGGCSSFLGVHFARNAPKVERGATPVILAATEAGRSQLAEEQTGAAIESFQRALANGEPPAPALNGLGVAYARLGRDDLAQRFFEEAIAMEPTDSRYADNLTRLTRSPSYAMRSSAALIAETDASVLATKQSDPAASEQPAPVGKLQRLSRAEVHITTAAPQAAPLRSTAAVRSGQFKPIVRFTLSPEEPQGFKPLIRFELPAPKAGSGSQKLGANR